MSNFLAANQRERCRGIHLRGLVSGHHVDPLRQRCDCHVKRKYRNAAGDDGDRLFNRFESCSFYRDCIFANWNRAKKKLPGGVALNVLHEISRCWGSNTIPRMSPKTEALAWLAQQRTNADINTRDASTILLFSIEFRLL